VVYAFEDLAQISLEQIDVRWFEDMGEEGAQKQITLRLGVIFQGQGFSHWAAWI
jgi:hypothetical protein